MSATIVFFRKIIMSIRADFYFTGVTVTVTQ
jgi:hypothetical protein